MAKRKMKPPPPEVYWFEIDDWEMYYSLVAPDDEHSCMSLTGKIIEPEVKNATKARIELVRDARMDDPSKFRNMWSSENIGHIQTLRDRATLLLICWLPTQAFNTIYMAVSTVV